MDIFPSFHVHSLAAACSYTLYIERNFGVGTGFCPCRNIGVLFAPPLQKKKKDWSHIVAG
jgi:hypothetical protein